MRKYVKLSANGANFMKLTINKLFEVNRGNYRRIRSSNGYLYRGVVNIIRKKGATMCSEL